MKKRETFFAPAEKADEFEIKKDNKRILSAENVRDMLDALAEPVAVLNANRQIVFANKELVALIGDENLESIIGKRPGEALCCSNVESGDRECGTTERCKYCGAVNAILEGIEGKRNSKECRITIISSGEEVALDLLVTAAPFTVEETGYVLMMVSDISSEKRRKFLERIFFHDIINTAGSLSGLIKIMSDFPEDINIDEELKNANIVCRSLLYDIAAQRDLAAAESGDLEIELTRMNCAEILREAVLSIRHHQVASGKNIEENYSFGTLELESDADIIKRILTNMIKNALEASSDNQTVTVSYGTNEGLPQFRVHNESHMPEDVQLQLFQRSFSTKGSGRGLGTYSMKLLATRYLKGQVSFVSSRAGGTLFMLTLPLSLSE